MDELYHQNTNNQDCPIKCNVVSNQLNFVNSINYRNKNDFNSSLAHIEINAKDNINQCSNEFAPSGTGDNNDQDEDR